MFQDTTTPAMLEVRETIERKIQTMEQNQPTASPPTGTHLQSNADQILSNCLYHDDDYFVAAIHRATIKLLPNDNLRQVYAQLNTHGYKAYSHHHQQQQQRRQQWCEEPTQPLSNGYAASNYSGVPPSSARTYRTNQTYQHEHRSGPRTAKTNRKQDQIEKKRRLDIQKRDMEKRKAIEKQIRASQLARFALRKTTQKKMT